MVRYGELILNLDTRVIYLDQYVGLCPEIELDHVQDLSKDQVQPKDQVVVLNLDLVI